jgi:hypothetical protein
LKDRYGREIEEKREFDFRPPPKGPDRRAIRLIIILLFLIAVIIMAFPNNDERQAPDAGAEGGERAGQESQT